MFYICSIALGHGEYVDRAAWRGLAARLGLEGAGIPSALLGAKAVVYMWADGVAPVNSLGNSPVNSLANSLKCLPNDYPMSTK